MKNIEKIEVENYNNDSDNNNIFQSRVSLNDNNYSDADSEDDPKNMEYRYERRIGRQFSINHNFVKNEKFNKVIIPYNFQKKMYDIKDKDIEFYENKQYLKEKLEEFNINPDFNIEKKFVVRRMGQKLKIYLPIIIIMIILIYISLIVILFFCFNPFVIYTIYSWTRKAFNSLRLYKSILLEKFRVKEIQKIIENENLSEICKLNRILWNVGKSGYWLEIQKILS